MKSRDKETQPRSKIKIVRKEDHPLDDSLNQYSLVLALLAVAESNLVKAGKDSAMPHFIALVKELEHLHGFSFAPLEEIAGVQDATELAAHAKRVRLAKDGPPREVAPPTYERGGEE